MGAIKPSQIIVLNAIQVLEFLLESEPGQDLHALILFQPLEQVLSQIVSSEIMLNDAFLKGIAIVHGCSISALES